MIIIVSCFLSILVSFSLFVSNSVSEAFATSNNGFRTKRRLHLQMAANETATVGIPQSIPMLQSKQFRHPFDQRLTSMVQNAPFYGLAEETLRRAFPFIEQSVRLDLMSSSVKVSPQQMPHVYELLVNACSVLNVSSVPELYVQSNPQANAYTLALQSKDTTQKSLIVVTSALVDRCTQRELQAVLGHELGHLKCEHALYLTLGNLASSPLRQLPVVGRQMDSMLQEWRLAAEYTCDRAALLVAQDLEVASSSLLKLVAGTSRYELSVKAFVQQSVDYEQQLNAANPLVRMSIQQQARTHPLPVRRVAELEKWHRSKNFKSLLSTANQNTK